MPRLALCAGVVWNSPFDVAFEQLSAWLLDDDLAHLAALAGYCKHRLIAEVAVTDSEVAGLLGPGSACV